MSLNNGKSLSQSKIPAGTVLLEPGDNPDMLWLLHKGSAIVENTHGETTILYQHGENSAPGFASLLLKKNHTYRIRTTRESIVSGFPIKSSKFSDLIMGKLNVGLLAIRSLLQEVMASRKAFMEADEFSKKQQKVLDNLSLAYYRANPSDVEREEDGTAGEEIEDRVMSHIQSTVRDFQDNGGEVPNPISRNWMDEDHSGILRRDYACETELDLDEMNFLRRILSLPMNIQSAMYKSDISLMAQLGNRLAKLLETSREELVGLHHNLDENMKDLLIDDYSLAGKFFLLADTIESGIVQVATLEFADYIRFFYENGEQFSEHFAKRLGRKYSSDNLNTLKSFLESNQEVQQEAARAEVASNAGASGTEVTTDYDGILNDLNNSISKISAFAGLAPDEIKHLSGEMKKLREMQNPMDSGGDPRKLRRQLEQSYWKVYEACFKKNEEAGGNVPTPVRMMLNYGYFDEEFLDKEHLVFLYNATDLTRPRLDYPIQHATEWLKKVAGGQEPPSVDEMGLTYFEKLKHEFKDQGWKRESDMPDEINTYDRRLSFEINNFLYTNVRLTSGAPTTAFPILNKHHIILPLEKCFVTNERMSSVLDEILGIDYSAFHREVLVNDEEAGILKEFIQEQVIPNFIIVPSIGTKVMMWQELSTRNKNSTGRIAVPIFSTADLKTLVLEAIGAFRWELTKTIQGADWNNISVPSITAEYTDYVQFYKKNRELSPEIKERLASEFKRFRTDRDRFVNDYLNWIKFEAAGTMKLNRVARGIFYRYVPFAKALRDEMANQPAFADLHNRFTNIRKKKLREFEARYRKYGDFDALPEKLQGNIEFYRV